MLKTTTFTKIRNNPRKSLKKYVKYTNATNIVQVQSLTHCAPDAITLVFTKKCSFILNTAYDPNTLNHG